MKYTILAITSIFLFTFLSAQTNKSALQKESYDRRKSILKINITSPILKNYALQYEYIVKRSFSLALSARVMPAARFPLGSTIKRQFVDVDNELLNDAFSDFRFSNFAITPEARFYLGKKGYGQGFYIAPYYRFATYKIHNTVFDYDADDGETYNLNVSGNLTSHTGGILFGAQWQLTKKLSLDWWIAGPNFGAGKGKINGITNQSLTDEAKDDVRKYLEEIEIPFSKKTVYVADKTARVDLSGPWGGIRTGVLIGVSF